MHDIGAGLKHWRESKELTQPEAATCLGMPFRTYQNYERNVRPPKTDAWQKFVSAGINANWLLTGEGPMLLADLAPPPIQAPKINVDALAAILEGTLRVAPGAAPSAIASHCVSVYVKCLEDGFITPDGVGSGNLENAA